MRRAAAARAHPGAPIHDKEQREALSRLARASRRRRPDRAVTAVLERQLPRARLDLPPVEAVATIDSYLFVQGPPGSGKTWQGAKMAVALMRAGQARRRHVAQPQGDQQAPRGDRAGGARAGLRRSRAGRSRRGNAESRFEGGSSTAPTAGATARTELQLVAGTAWLFAREDFEGVVDTLFVDEAGQVSLADAMAVGSVARNLVFLGDPNQLPQVSQGAQRDEAKVSVLQHLLGEHETVPPERGIFLEHTWRLRRRSARSRPRRTTRDGCSRRGVRRRTLAGEDGLVLQPHRHEASSPRRRRTPWRRDPLAPRDDVTATASSRDRSPGRLPRRRAVQRAGARAAAARPRGGARRDGRQVPGAGGAGRAHLDGELDRRGRAARDRLRVQPPPRERRDVARAVPRRARVRAAPARRRLQDGRGHAARERGLPLRRARGRVAYRGRNWHTLVTHHQGVCNWRGCAGSTSSSIPSSTIVSNGRLRFAEGPRARSFVNASPGSS